MSPSFAKAVLCLGRTPPPPRSWVTPPVALTSLLCISKKGSLPDFLRHVRLHPCNLTLERLSQGSLISRGGNPCRPPVVTSPGTGPCVRMRAILEDAVSPAQRLPGAGSLVALSEGCIDSGGLRGIARKAGTRDSAVETSGSHNNQLNQDIIHAKPLAWAT